MDTEKKSPFNTLWLVRLKEYFQQEPLLLIILIIMTILVLKVPLVHIGSILFYKDQPYASPAFAGHPLLNNSLLLWHITAAVPAIILGPFLLSPFVRKHWLHLHRQLGKWYFVGCTISAITVFPLALQNSGGTVAHIGFGMMAVTWLFVTWMAYASIRNRDIVAHRRWMMRSYAMTFAFVHVNLTYKHLLPYEMFTLQGVRTFQSMISWQFNLMCVELYLAATSHTGRFLGFRTWAHNLTHFAPQDKFYLGWPKRVRSVG